MKVRIGLGIASLPFESARAFWRWVDLCEGSQVDSIWQTDRLSSPEPFLESMSTMAALAGGTERLKFGMNAVVAPFRDPLVLAKQCATIDYLSGGRLLPVFGVGADDAPEWDATGRSPGGRGARADEMLALMRRLWSEESVDHAGACYTYRGASIAPRPVQDPLPLWIGGQSRAAVRRTARLGTGWLAGIQTPAQVKETVAAIRAEARAQGTRIPEDHYGAGIPFRFGPGDDAYLGRVVRARSRAAGRSFDPAEYFAIGQAADILARIEAYRSAGVSKFVLIPLARGDAALMDQTRRVIDEVLPVAHAWR